MITSLDKDTIMTAYQLVPSIIMLPTMTVLTIRQTHVFQNEGTRQPAPGQDNKTHRKLIDLHASLNILHARVNIALATIISTRVSYEL